MYFFGNTKKEQEDGIRALVATEDFGWGTCNDVDQNMCILVLLQRLGGPVLIGTGVTRWLSEQ